MAQITDVNDLILDNVKPDNLYLGEIPASRVYFDNLVYNVLPSVVIGILVMPQAAVGYPYNYDISGLIEGALSYGYNGTLPADITFDEQTGIFSSDNITATFDPVTISVYGINGKGQGEVSNDSELESVEDGCSLYFDGTASAYNENATSTEYTYAYYDYVATRTDEPDSDEYYMCGYSADGSTGFNVFYHMANRFYLKTYADNSLVNSKYMPLSNGDVSVGDTIRIVVNKYANSGNTRITLRVYSNGVQIGYNVDSNHNNFNFVIEKFYINSSRYLTDIPVANYPKWARLDGFGQWYFDSGSTVSEPSINSENVLNYNNVVEEDWTCIEVLPQISGVLEFPDAIIGYPYSYDLSTIITDADSYGYNGTLPADITFDSVNGIFHSDNVTEASVSSTISVYGVNMYGQSEDSNTDDLEVLVDGCKLLFDGSNYAQIEELDGKVPDGSYVDFQYTVLTAGAPSANQKLLFIEESADTYNYLFYHTANRFYITTRVDGVNHQSFIQNQTALEVGDVIKVRRSIRDYGSTIRNDLNVWVNGEIIGGTYNTTRHLVVNSISIGEWTVAREAIPTRLIIQNYDIWDFNSGNILEEPSRDNPTDPTYNLEYVNVVEEDWTCIEVLPQVGTLDMPEAVIGYPYTYDISSIITDADSYGYTGTLPDGISFDEQTGIFSSDIIPESFTPTTISVYGVNMYGQSENSNDSDLEMT